MPADRQSGSAVAGSHPSEAPSVAGNSSASRFWCPERGPGLMQPESIGEAHPAQTVGRRDPAAVCLHPTPVPRCGWRLRVAGCFLLPGRRGGGTPRAPTLLGGRPGVSGRGHPGTRVPAPPGVPDFPDHKRHPLPPPWPASAGRAGTLPRHPWGLPRPPPLPTLAGAPTSRGFMHAPSLLTIVSVSDPAASSGEAPTPEPAKPRLREGGIRKAGGSCRAGVAARERRTGGLLWTQRHPHPRTIAAGKAKRKGLPGLNRSLGAQGAAGRAKKPTQVR